MGGHGFDLENSGNEKENKINEIGREDMSVHKKLMEARIKLQSIKMKKSGINKFAGYDYFELSDFIPHVQKIFYELGLCGVVSYERDMAKLTITDTETSTEIIITSPMEPAILKGCHPIQNLGAVETYQRRYLWVTAMEILENDIVDGSPSLDSKEQQRPAEKKIITPENKLLWDRAKKAFIRDGNLEAVLAFAKMSKDHQVQLMEECSQ